MIREAATENPNERVLAQDLRLWDILPYPQGYEGPSPFPKGIMADTGETEYDILPLRASGEWRDRIRSIKPYSSDIRELIVTGLEFEEVATPYSDDYGNDAWFESVMIRVKVAAYMDFDFDTNQYICQEGDDEDRFYWASPMLKVTRVRGRLDWVRML